MSLARDIFPADPSVDPGYAFADSNLFTLSYHAGKVYTYAGNISEAFAAFDLYQQYTPDTTIPERIRLEIINAQSRAAIHANNLEQYAMFVDTALSGALALGSRKRFTEAYRIFQREMPRDWLATRQIQALVEQ